MEINQRLIARDCVLCPEHTRHLDEHLLMDISSIFHMKLGAA